MLGKTKAKAKEKDKEKVEVKVRTLSRVIAHMIAHYVTSVVIKEKIVFHVLPLVRNNFSMCVHITEKQDRAKAMGLFGAAFGLGFIIGPAIGGILAGSDPNNPSVFLPPIVAAVLSFIALIVALISLKETNLSVNGFEKKRLKSLISALEFPNLRQLILLSFCITVVFALMESTISLWSERTLFWGAQQNGYLFAFAGICGALVQGIL